MCRRKKWEMDDEEVRNLNGDGDKVRAVLFRLLFFFGKGKGGRKEQENNKLEKRRGG